MANRAHHIGDLDAAAALRLPHGGGLAARYRKGVGDLLGAQHAPRVRQGGDLRYGAAYAPARSQFAAVQDDFSVIAERFVSKPPDDRWWPFASFAAAQ